MRVLIACERSGVVRDEFAKRGHDAWSCDLVPCETIGNHIQGDAREILDDGWDLMIAHPSCTRLANSGVRWLHERNLWKELDAACEFFCSFLNAPIPRKGIENPIPHRHAVERIGKKYTQIIQPWMFGHGETKATCLWLDGLPPLRPTKIVEGREQRIWKLPPGESRWIERSRTLPGIAAAMAEQWGNAK